MRASAFFGRGALWGMGAGGRAKGAWRIRGPQRVRCSDQPAGLVGLCRCQLP
ncbi:hypothetical protein [Acetobacter syzygii]|uniref:hypothetical protein n=1 Tax=Acetobacter syzygii TaxID=146476 RepID=UPI0015CB676F|nr:hypothetical protein [Acetobacter syzygii]